MRIQGIPYKTLREIHRADGGTFAGIEVIDQRFLPYKFQWAEIHSPEDCANAIAEMKVRGAPLIGITAAYGIAMTPIGHKLDVSYETLVKSRPTAVNLKWALDQQLKETENLIQTKASQLHMINKARELLEKDVTNCEQMGEYGFDIIQEIYRETNKTVNILTHCNAGWLACLDWGTATSPIYKAHHYGIPVHVWVDETRPRNQGALLTAFELKEEGVPHTIITDNAGGHIMQQGLVDLVLVGSDRTTARGDVCNKIGTYLKALAAKDNQIPFYVVLPTSSIDMEISEGLKEIVIEERNHREVSEITGINSDGKLSSVSITNPESDIFNPSFDVTPALLVTALITEKGVISPNRQSISKIMNL